MDRFPTVLWRDQQPANNVGAGYDRQPTFWPGPQARSYDVCRGEEEAQQGHEGQTRAGGRRERWNDLAARPPEADKHHLPFSAVDPVHGPESLWFVFLQVLEPPPADINGPSLLLIAAPHQRERGSRERYREDQAGDEKWVHRRDRLTL